MRRKHECVLWMRWHVFLAGVPKEYTIRKRINLIIKKIK